MSDPTSGAAPVSPHQRRTFNGSIHHRTVFRPVADGCDAGSEPLVAPVGASVADALGATHLAVVAIGANLADPMTQVVQACDALASLAHTRLLRRSSLYRTAPIGMPGQPDFINAVAVLSTTLRPVALLEGLLTLERRFGRRREFHHAPRTIDLDLLLYDQVTLQTPRLSLPHPRMHLRAFVLAPLLEVTPQCRIPGRGFAAAWLPAVSMQRVERIPPDES